MHTTTTGIAYQMTWVKGHASWRKRPKNFTDAELLNEAADTMATSARRNSKMATHIHWPEQQISLIGPHGRVSGRLPTDVCYCVILAAAVRMDKDTGKVGWLHWYGFGVSAHGHWK
jgi:hypothetical protein